MTNYPDESKYRIDPNITAKIMDSKGVNYGHAISKMFDGLGDIEVKKEANAQKQEDRALTQESLKLGIENAKSDREIKNISVQQITDGVQDKNLFANIISSENPQEAYKNAKFKDPAYAIQVNDFLTKNKNTQINGNNVPLNIFLVKI